jgi:base plate wedge protein 53
MGKYFDKMPKIYYSLTDDRSNPEIVTDVTFSVRLLEQYAEDSKYFYTIIIKDGLKPEDVANLVYGDPQLHWIVLQFNKVINPRFEWPLSTVNLDKYIIDKYGSIGNADQSIKTYFKVITYISSTSSSPYVYNIEVTQNEYNAIVPDLAGTDYLLQNSETVTVKTDRDVLSYYDWEVSENERKREISLIQAQYVDSIRNSLNTLVK